MGKKNPFVFTIGFDKSDPDHVYVTELLNTTEKKAKPVSYTHLDVYKRQMLHSPKQISRSGKH